jgi:predicted dehydrogenase
VTARTYSLKQNRYSVEDTALVIIECEKGTAQINLTWSADKRANSASLVSEAGSLYYNGETLTKHINGVSELIPVPDVSDKTTYIQQYVCLFNEFTNLTGSGTGRHISEAYDSVRLLNAAYSSAEKNITITLD